MTNKPNEGFSQYPEEGNLTPGLRRVPDPGRTLWVRGLMQVLWPAFIGAAITVGVLFSLIDPVQIEWVHVYLEDSREAAYTAGFIAFWIMYSVACFITWFLATTEVPGGKIGINSRADKYDE